MKRLKLISHCHHCGEKFPGFHKKAEHEIYIRRYVGGQGHLVEIASHPKCLIESLEIDFLLKGWSPPNGDLQGKDPGSKSSRENDVTVA